ncbi:helix-turn-helix domain-containing protein [Streptomyces actuosus]|uniref:helix-turn-helix domain-containing protein n=1 Tax=Streptomyces actuosus TaxID=1885 RepID=UPI001F067668|nr:helix-turn-helix domain-containing protein [Streptomyces actuosus]
MPAGGDVMTSLVFDSDDLEATEDFLCRAYARMTIGSSGPRGGRLRIRRDIMPSVSVDEVDLGFDMSYAVTPLGRICLCMVHEGTIRDHVFPGVRDDFGPGDMVLFAPPDLPYAGRVRTARYNITMLDPGLLDQVAVTGPARSPEPVRSTGHRPHSPAAAHRLRSAIVRLRDHVLADPATADESAGPVDRRPAPRGERAGRLPEHRAHRSDGAGPERRTPGDPAAGRRPHRGPRRPAAHRRRHRRRGPRHRPGPAVRVPPAPGCDPAGPPARCAARARAPGAAGRRPRSGATVSGIAARWGFPHAGRFAALYREAYGTSPSAGHRPSAPAGGPEWHRKRTPAPPAIRNAKRTPGDPAGARGRADAGHMAALGFRTIAAADTHRRS